MAVDVTDSYWQAATGYAKAKGLDDDQLKKFRSAQILRSLGSKNDFTKAGVEVVRFPSLLSFCDSLQHRQNSPARFNSLYPPHHILCLPPPQAHNITSLRSFIKDNQAPYLQLGKLRESERDAIEEEVAAYVRSCSSNIAKLQNMLHTIPTNSPAKKVAPSPQLMAHRQGMVLILSERLGALTAAFDRLRGLRYQQLQRKEANRQRRLPKAASSSNHKGSSLINGNMPQTTAALHDHLHGTSTSSTNGESHNLPHDQQQQAQLNQENLALQLELINMTDQVQHAERTVREIATLNQMFSAAILHQSEQIEKLYNEAVAVTGNIGNANVQLDKAIRTNKSAQKLLLFLLLLASASVLFLDWFYS